MGNALEELKARGWALTAHNDDAGVARGDSRVSFSAADNRHRGVGRG